MSLGHDNITMTAAYALAVSIVIQTVVMGAYLLWREPGEIGRVIAPGGCDSANSNAIFCDAPLDSRDVHSHY